jgi:hypothetical protein
VPFITQPSPNGSEPEKKVQTAEDFARLDRNRRWLVEQTGIRESYWTDKAVRQVAQVMPEPMTWKNRIMICCPIGELGYSFFWQMLTGQVKHIGWHIDNSLLMTNSGQYLQDNHNTMVTAALQIPGWNYILFMEHDHTFPTNTLELVGEYSDPIVGALYFNRVAEDPQPVVYKWNPTRTAIGRLQPYQMAPILEKKGLYEVDVVPMGCTAIRRDVFENWPKDLAWFASPTSATNGKAMSDDVYFCRHAQDQGYPIKVDSRIIPKHWGLIGIDERMYVSWFRQMQKEGKTAPVADHVWNAREDPVAMAEAVVADPDKPVVEEAV